MFKIGYRTMKTAAGAALSILLAQSLDLKSFTGAGIITILCIQTSKKKSLHAAFSRLVACFTAMVYCSVLFQLIGFNPLVIGLILLLFIPVTVALKVNEGIVTSTVIILHLYSAGEITWKLLLNEAELIGIGVGVALLVNWYMPSLENKLIRYQEQVEENFTRILHELAGYLRDDQREWNGKEITETDELIAKAKSLAFRNVENHFQREKDVYYHYFKMREKQFDIIKRILPLAADLPATVKQGGILADFIDELGDHVHPQNTVMIFLDKLDDMEQVFKAMKLPSTRKEFESRAALWQLMKEMESYLLIKLPFKGLPVKERSESKGAEGIN